MGGFGGAHMGGFSGAHAGGFGRMGGFGHFGHGYGYGYGRYGGYGYGLYGLGYGLGLGLWDDWYPYDDYGYDWYPYDYYPSYAYGYGYPSEAVGNYCVTPVTSCDVPVAEGTGAGCACRAANGHFVQGHIGG